MKLRNKGRNAITSEELHMRTYAFTEDWQDYKG